MVEEDRMRIDGEAFYADHIRRRGRWRVSQWNFQFTRVMTPGPQPHHPTPISCGGHHHHHGHHVCGQWLGWYKFTHKFIWTITHWLWIFVNSIVWIREKNILIFYVFWNKLNFQNKKSLTLSLMYIKYKHNALKKMPQLRTYKRHINIAKGVNSIS